MDIELYTRESVYAFPLLAKTGDLTFRQKRWKMSVHIWLAQKSVQSLPFIII